MEEITTLQQDQNAKTRNFSRFYFFVFFGIGSLFPLLSLYLKDEIGLSGSQIGTIMSISPVVMIIVQPIWGILSDLTQKPPFLLTLAIFVTSIFGMIYSFLDSYIWIMITATLLAIVQSAIIPLSDSMAVNYVQKTRGQYGSLRLWGAIGFAVAVLIVGWLSDQVGLSVIFYVFSVTLLLSCLFAWKLPKESNPMKISIRQGFKELLNVPRYFVFLFIAFLVLGPLLANNIYFGILIAELGGGLTGIGIAFLLSAGSEAPVMRFASHLISRLGMFNLLIFATAISAIRWYLYFIEPPLSIIYLTTIAQGLSFGLFMPASLQYVRDLAPKKVGATAISLYSAIGNGLGNWFCTIIGGLILEGFTVNHVYLFFGAMTSIGFLVLVGFKLSEVRTG